MLEIVQQLPPPGYRTIFNLYVIDGFSHKEIAAQLGISIITSKSQLMKARNLLQKKLFLTGINKRTIMDRMGDIWNISQKLNW